MTNQMVFRLKLRPCSPDDVLSTAELIRDFYRFEMRHEYDPEFGKMLEMTATHTGHEPTPLGMPTRDSLQSHFHLLQSRLTRVLHYSCDVTLELSEINEIAHRTVACGGTVIGELSPPKKRKGRVVVTEATDLF
jgi:hypothetical protein